MFYLKKNSYIEIITTPTIHSLKLLWQFRGILNKCEKSEIRFFKEDDPVCRFWKGYGQQNKESDGEGYRYKLKKGGGRGQIGQWSNIESYGENRMLYCNW